MELVFSQRNDIGGRKGSKKNDRFLAIDFRGKTTSPKRTVILDSAVGSQGILAYDGVFNLKKQLSHRWTQMNTARLRRNQINHGLHGSHG